MGHEVMKRIVAWATDAGRHEALMAKHEGRNVDTEGEIGLWQSFQAEFPKDDFVGNYDLAVTLYSSVFAESAKACAKAITGEW